MCIRDRHWGMGARRLVKGLVYKTYPYSRIIGPSHGLTGLPREAGPRGVIISGPIALMMAAAFFMATLFACASS